MTAGNNKWIGQSVERLEDPPLVTGRGRFAGDINFPHQLHMRIVRSQPRARPDRRDRHRRRRVPCPASSRSGPRPTSPTCRRSISARAGSRRSSRTGSRCWRPTRCATSASRSPRCSPRTPMSPRTPPISSPRGRGTADRCSTRRGRAGRILGRPQHRSGRDPPGLRRRRCGVQSAPHVVELELAIGRHSGVPLETRGAIGRYDASRDILELHGAAKVPHRNQELLARMLEPRAVLDPVLRSRMSAAASASAASSIPRTCWSASRAMRLERPVKWIEDRREHLIAANHSRNQHPSHPRRGRPTRATSSPSTT